MRSPLTKTVRRDAAESELNLPPGFRFHPTDEELIVHYLRPKTQSTWSTTHRSIIIADVDIYKHEPWELPEMALFGTKEWYFFTPRDRKYPNGSRPNRVTGNGYWKATGADKPICSKSDKNTTTIGIKKALVFYAGKGVKGIKTNWIMHEYRLASSKLDEWVLCRLYNKKNNPKEMIILLPHQQEEEEEEDNNNIHRTESVQLQKQNSPSESFESSGDVMFSQPECLTKVKEDKDIVDDDWVDGLNLEDLHHCLEAMPLPHHLYDIPMLNYIYNSNQQYFFHLNEF